MTRIWTPAQVANYQLTGRTSWYRIAATTGAATEISIYDAIGEWGVTARDFLNDLSMVKGAVELHLNSEGGEVFDGMAIYDALKRRGGVTVVVDSLAASISSVIAQAGERRIMAPNATMMIHDASSGMAGNASELRSLADLLDMTSDNIASVYADRSGTDVAAWRAAMQATTWYSAADAVKAGLADEVRGGAPITAAVDKGNITAANAADLNTAARKYAASQGWAMADGSYPIRPLDNHGSSDLDSAIRAVGRGSGDHDAIRAHITKRAKALGLGDRIPGSWPGAEKKDSTASLATIADLIRGQKGTQ